MNNQYITQKVLAKYYSLMCKQKELDAKRSELRDWIVTRMQAGVPVEYGRFESKISTFQKTTLTKKAVIEALGEAEYESLREQVQPQQQTNLRVVDTDSK